MYLMLVKNGFFFINIRMVEICFFFFRFVFLKMFSILLLGFFVVIGIDMFFVVDFFLIGFLLLLFYIGNFLIWGDWFFVVFGKGVFFLLFG